MLDFIRAACAVCPVRVGDPSANAEEICAKIDAAGNAGADLLVFPELAVTGYTCGDLFFQRPLLDGTLAALRKITDHSRGFDGIAAVGAPLVLGGQLYNCACVLAQGKIQGIVPKTFLPNYNEYYEKRWFSTAPELTCDHISARQLGFDADYDIPVGADLLFACGGARIGVELCEDLWTPLPPSTLLAMAGAELIVNLSASNETIAKREYRRQLVCQQSARTLTGYIYASAGASESTTDVIFSGHSLIAENGALLKENEKLIDDENLIAADIDLGRIRADRLKLKCFKDSAAVYQLPSYRTVEIPAVNDDFSADGTLHPLSRLPFVPDTKSGRLQRCMDIFEMQVAGLKKRLQVTGAKAVVGVSGGLDSTLALLVSAQAMKELNRPVTDLIGITMPCFGTSDRTYRNALTLMEKLGVSIREINIREACTMHCRDVGHDISRLDVTFENIQARERTQILMDVASEVGGFVVGTGDLSELALGWCTYNADHMSMYGVNASIPKTLIRWMIASVAQYDVFESCSAVLEDIIDTPISPELLPPDEKGNIAQETESIIGPYALHDFFLYYMLRYGFSPAKIYALARRAFKDDFSGEEILKWLRSFYRRFFTQQFKRSCLPDGVKVGSICLSPRGDWRMPSDASAALWLQEVDRLKA